MPVAPVSLSDGKVEKLILDLDQSQNLTECFFPKACLAQIFREHS